MKRFVWVYALGALCACQSFAAEQSATKSPAGISEIRDKYPPRTVHDITTILDQYQPDPAATARARAEATKSVPPGLTGKNLAPFYLERSRAAERLGNVKQYIADAREAAKHGANTDLYPDIVREIALAEMFGGNFNNTMAAAEVWVKDTVGRSPARAAAALSLQARLHADAGDLALAHGLLEKAEAQTRAALQSNTRNRKYYTHFWTRNLQFAKGNVFRSAGRYPEAELAFREALRQIELDAPFQRQRVANDLPGTTDDSWELTAEGTERGLAFSMMRQGRLHEAEVATRNVLKRTLLRRGRDSTTTAISINLLASIVAEQGRSVEAAQLYAAALESLQKAGATPDSLFVARARRLYAGSLVEMEKWQDALTEYERLRKDLGADPLLQERLGRGDVRWALALMNTGQADAAVAMLERSVEKMAKGLGENHYETAEARGFFAMALVRKREPERAYREFAKAIPVLTARSAGSEDQGTIARTKRLIRIVEAYIGLLYELRGSQLERNSGVVFAAEAFRLADVARGQSVQRAVSDSAARAAAVTPALAELVRKEQDSKRELDALYALLNQMLSAPVDQQVPKIVDGLRETIAQRQKELNKRRQQISVGFPKYADLVNPAPPTVAQARAALRPGEALISVLVVPDRTYVWAFRKDGPLGFTASSLKEKDIRGIVAELRRAVDPEQFKVGTIPQFNVVLAHRLYAELLAPVEAGWKGANTLLVADSGPLVQLPPQVLVTAPTTLPSNESVLFASYKNVPWLAKQAAIAQLPSVNSLVALRALGGGSPDRSPFIGFGDPQFGKQSAPKTAVARSASPSLRNLSIVRGTREAVENNKAAPDWMDYSEIPALPDTRDEILALAQALKADPRRDVFLGKDASRRQVMSQDLSKRRIVAFATHGLLPGDMPGLTQPALALAAPEQGNESGLLTLDEILTLKLDADWVVLSACNTAAGDGSGAEALSGLGRGFFYAGSRALLATHWPVESASARQLVTGTFERYAKDPNITRAEALRQSALALLDGPGHVDPVTGKVLFSYGHPIFWAPYALIGDGGRSAAP